MTVSWDELERPEKQQAREHVFRAVSLRRSTLFMPAAQALCVAKALDMGVINREGRLIAVERDPMVAVEMMASLARLAIPATIHQGELHRLVLIEALDFAFIDLNGNLNQFTADWVSRVLADNLDDDAVLVFTLAHAWRANRFLPRCMASIRANARELVEALANRLDCSDYDILYNVALFSVLFRDWHFKTDFRLRYRDLNSVPMTAYRFYDFRKRALPLPYDLIDGLVERV